MRSEQSALAGVLLRRVFLGMEAIQLRNAVETAGMHMRNAYGLAMAYLGTQGGCRPTRVLARLALVRSRWSLNIIENVHDPCASECS